MVLEKVRCPWTDSLSSSGFGALFKVLAHEDDGEQNLRKIKRKCAVELHGNMEYPLQQACKFITY